MSCCNLATQFLRKKKINNFKAYLIDQQSFFVTGVCASYVAAEIIAKTGRPFTEAELVRQGIVC
jgi:hypothetical protein